MIMMITSTTSAQSSMINMDHNEQGPKEFPSFSISQEELTKLVQENNFTSLQQSGGVQGIAAALETHLENGLCDLDVAHFHRRHQVFGSNFMFDDNCRYSLKGKGNFCGLIIIDAMKDTTILLLLCCAILSFVLGVKRNGLKEEILDGLVMLIVIFTVFHVSRIITFLKDMVRNHDDQKVSKKRKLVSVLRDGKLQDVSVSEVVVGDVVFLKKGNQAPADGLFVRGERLKLDDDDHDHDPVHDYSDYSKFPSILTGAKVVSGNCYMLVTSVGSNTEASKMMRLLKTDQNKESSTSKLKTAIDKVNSRLEKIGLTISLLALLVQVIRCFIWSSSSTGCAAECSGNDLKDMQETVEDIMSETTKIMIKKQGGTNRFVEMLCVLVFALRDGLPLGLLISFYAFKKLMISYQAIIRNLPVCGSIGLVTAVCIDKTNDMSLEPTKMVDLHIGLDKVSGSSTEVDVYVLNRLREGIGTNTSDSEDDHRLLIWAKQVLRLDVQEIKRSCNIKALDHLNNNKNRTGSLVTWNGSEESKTFATIHWKGEPEIILPMCTNYFDVHGALQPMDKDKRDHEFKEIVKSIAADDDSLSCVAFAYRQVEEDKGEVPVHITNKFTLLGFVSLKNPYTLEVKQALKKVYEESGAKMKLILEEEISTARLMATNLGILKPEEDTEEAMLVEATVFRNSSEKTRELMVSNIKVLANASPLDKLLMIQCLRRKGEVVAATGRHTMDSPSLKEADIGLLMGDKSSEMAKENSDIVVLDKNLSTVVGILLSGRSLWQNIQKIIQLQFTLQIAAFAMNQIGAFFCSEVPLEPFQLLWFNFVMDVLGALALAGPILLQEQAHGAGTLTTKTMWKNILVQVVYQVTFFWAIQLKGKEVLQANQTAINAIVFNTFVLCQVFVLINARKIEKPNVFEGMMALQYQNKYWFLVTVLTIFALQICTVEIITIVNHGKRIMNLKNWCVCIGIAIMSLPIGLVAKLIPWP